MFESVQSKLDGYCFIAIASFTIASLLFAESVTSKIPEWIYVFFGVNKFKIPKKRVQMVRNTYHKI